MSVTVYAARKMTDRQWPVIIRDAENADYVFSRYGILVLDPVTDEARRIVAAGGRVAGFVGSGPQVLDLGEIWRRDKAMIRMADVFVDCTAGEHSEGVAHELGYARYFLWMPIVRVFENELKPSSVARYEDDVIVGSFDEAAKIIVRCWGTRRKRIVWRAKMFWRCWLRAAWRRLLKWR